MSDRLRFNGLGGSGDKKKIGADDLPKQVQVGRLHMTGFSESEKKQDFLKSPELLVGKVLIQRDGGKRYEVEEYNAERRQFFLRSLESSTSTVNLGADNLISKLSIEGSPWRLE